MKFLIVGASGFIGKHIFEYAKFIGYNVIGTQYRSNCAGLVNFNILKDRLTDCVDSDFFRYDKPVFGIICSAISQTDQCFKDKKNSYEINVEKTVNLIEELHSLGVLPVFFSSDNVYSGLLGHYTEDDKFDPMNEYGQQKVEVENYLRNHERRSVILRLSKIVGDSPSGRHLFSEWHSCIEKRQPICCIEGQVFSPTFVKDIAKAVVLACEKELVGAYNVANKDYFLRAELAKQFISALGAKDIEVISKPMVDFGFAQPRPQKSYLDSSRFIKETGIQFTPMCEVFKLFIENLALAKNKRMIYENSLSRSQC